MANTFWQEPPNVPLLQWLVRGSLRQNFLQAIRLWVWLHLLYGEMSDTLALPETFSYTDWRDRFFTPDHPTGETKPAPHDLACPCAKLTAAWLFHPDLTLTQALWQVYQGKQPGQGQIKEQRDCLHQSLIDHDLLPPNLDHLLFQMRLFGFTRRTLSSDLHHLATIGWLHNQGNKFQKVTSYPDYPHAGSVIIKPPSNQELALFTQPDLAAIADTFSRTFQGYTRFFVHVDYVILSDRFADAFTYALHLHRYQSRKVNAVPYISHPIAVAALVLEDGGSEDEAIAALLHDAVEDQGGEPIYTEILHRYGSRVAAIVHDCTIPPRSASQTWKSHKLDYLNQIRHASPEAQRVILADKLHNLRSLISNLRQTGESTWSSFAASKADNLWLHQALADLFEQYVHSDMVAEFRQQIQTLLSLAINPKHQHLME